MYLQDGQEFLKLLLTKLEHVFAASGQQVTLVCFHYHYDRPVVDQQRSSELQIHLCDNAVHIKRQCCWKVSRHGSVSQEW